MLELLFASFIAIWFWGRTTKEVEEKTQLASKTRTCVYLLFTIIVAVFYYKTQQVATVYNHIKVQSIRDSRDKNNNLADTISGIRIANLFSSAGIVDREINKYVPGNKNRAGGTYVEICTHTADTFNYVTKNEYENSILYKAPFDNLGVFYNVIVLTTRIPFFLPYFFTYEFSDNFRDSLNNAFYIHMDMYDMKKHPEDGKFEIYIDGVSGRKETTYIESNPYQNAYLFNSNIYGNADFINKIKDHYATYYYGVSCKSSETNNLSFFTAADISQYIHQVQIVSDCHVKLLEFAYDLPIKINPYDSCMLVSAQGFRISGKFLQNNQNCLVFHVELPTLANLQLIRSLILTTLLTALVSLFFRNLYYCVRKKALKMREKYNVNEVQLNRLKFYCQLLFSLIFLCVMCMVIMLFNDNYLEIPIDWLDYIYCAFIVLLVVFAVILWKQFKKIYVRKKPRIESE